MIRLLLLLPLMVSSGFAGLSDELSIPPDEGGNFVQATFFLHVPEGVEQPRGIYVILPGWNSNGEALAQDRGLRQFCARHQLALISATLISRPEEGVPRVRYHYAAAENGSGAALEAALEQFADRHQLPSLASAPLLIQGYSAGGQFAYGMACYRPERVLAFAALKGGYYPSTAQPATSGVPGVLVMGADDLERRNTALKGLFVSHRSEGAPWVLLEEPGKGHEPGPGARLVRDFFESILALRLPERPGQPLEPINLGRHGILFELDSGRQTKAPEARTDPRYGWVPDVDQLSLWRELSE